MYEIDPLGYRRFAERTAHIRGQIVLDILDEHRRKHSSASRVCYWGISKQHTIVRIGPKHA